MRTNGPPRFIRGEIDRAGSSARIDPRGSIRARGGSALRFMKPLRWRGSCDDRIQTRRLSARSDGVFMAQDQAGPAPVSESERARMIAETLEGLREKFQADGGDIALVSIDGPRVKVRLTGACAGCGAANETLGWVRKQLSRALGGGPVSVIPALDAEPA
jgi:Fe-S cluster biogenesis protein NfuA